jgi:hypothetical protein
MATMRRARWCVNKWLLAFVLPIAISASCQGQKHDYIWMNGYGAQFGEPFGSFYLDFHSTPLDIVPTMFNNVELRGQVSSYSSKDGELLLVSNGCRFYDRFGNLLAGGDSLNPGKYYNEFCANGEGYYPVTFGMILLPLRGDSIFAIHLGLQLSSNFGLSGGPLYTSLLDVDSLGKINVINRSMILDYIEAERGAACRHGNGLDWYIVYPEISDTTFRLYHLHHEGIIYKSKRYVGKLFEYSNCPGTGMQSFSPDGRIFVRYNNSCGLVFYDFDRCSGEFSNERIITLPEVYFPGAFTVFSPNSRFCYYNSSRVIMQVDMEDPLLLPDTVAIVDSFPADFGAGFFAMQRGPDGRIYVSTGSSNKAWHVIEYPDVKGKACWVRPSGIIFPYLSARAIPHIPNYRLGALEGSPCDTLGGTSSVNESVGDERQAAFRLYPNPASREVTMELDQLLSHEHPFQVTVYSPHGVPVYRGTLPPWAYLRLNEFPPTSNLQHQTAWMIVISLVSGCCLLRCRLRVARCEFPTRNPEPATRNAVGR